MADDFSSMSDSELMEIAGISGGGGDDFSSMSNDQLFQLAGIEAPAVVRGGQSDLAQSLIGKDATNIQKLGRGIVGGMATTIPFLDRLIAGGASTVDDIGSYLQGAEVDPAGSYEQRLAEVRNYEKAFQEAISPSTTADIAHKVIPAFLVPGQNKLRGMVDNRVAKVGASAVEGFGLGGLFGASAAEPGQEVEGFQQGSAIGGLAGAGGGAVLEGAGALASGISGGVERAGGNLARKSLGARQSDYAKTANRLGIITDVPDDEIGTFTKSALDDLIETGELGASREPTQLIKTATQNERALEKQVGALVKAYEDTGATTAPTFERAYQMIADGSIPADKVPAFLKRLQALEQGIEDQGKGALSYLQKQKVAIGKDWVPEDSVRNEFTRAIYADIQRTIEEAVPGVKAVNQQLRKYKVLNPILERGLAADESATGFGKFIQAIRTSGGAGVPILAGAYTGHPVLGAAASAAIAASGSPRGMSAMGAGLKKGAGVLSAFGESAGVAGTPIGVASSQLQQTGEVEQRQERQQPQAGYTQQSLSARSNTEGKAKSFPSDNSPSVFSPKQTSLQGSVFNKLSAAVEKTESNGVADAVSPKGAVGLMQVTPIAFREVVRASGGDDSGLTNAEIGRKLKDPKLNKQVGEAYLKMMLDKYGDLELALAAYNHGPTAVDALIKKRGKSYADIRDKLPAETRAYVPKVRSIFEKA